jgi:flavin-dependent dehydrogenase
MSPDTDLLVVGGGPVGLAAALAARARGLEVVVAEPRAAPVDKACGEGLMPSAVARLARLGVDPPGRAFVGIRYVADRHEAYAPFRAGPGRGVRRTSLHETMTDAARAAGAVVLPVRVDDIRQDSEGVDAGGVRARWLLAADGLHSDVRRALGLELTRSAGGPAPRYGLRQHFALAPWTDAVEVHWSPRCEAYVTPVADDLVGVAVLGPAGLRFDQALVGLPRLADRLHGAEPVTRLRGAGPLRQRSSAVRQARVLLIGDAAGYVDALTGEGVAVGIASAEAAVLAVASGRPESYDLAWRQLSRRYRLFTGALLRCTRPSVTRRSLVPVAARVPRVFNAAVNFIA